MVAPARFVNELDALLQSMPAEQIDMDRIAATEQRWGRRFFDDPPELVYRWLLDRQRRLLGSKESPPRDS